MSFILYLVGFIFVIAGIAWSLIIAGVVFIKVVIVSLILLGIAILTGVAHTCLKDPPSN